MCALFYKKNLYYYSLTAHIAEIWKSWWLLYCGDIITGFLKKPGFRDHLSYVTTFVTSLEWSLKTGLTVYEN